MLAADYSQIELRIMAHLSGDAGLLEAFAAARTSTAPRGRGVRRAAEGSRPTSGAAPRRSTSG